MPLYDLAPAAPSTGGSTGDDNYHTGNTSDSSFGAVATSGVAHTKGAWTELIASTGFNAETLILNMATAFSLNATNRGALVDIGVGAAAAETVLIADLAIGSTPAWKTCQFPIAIPSGTRISVRFQCVQASVQIRFGAQLLEAGDHSAAPTACVSYGASTGTSVGVALSAPASPNTKATSWDTITASTSADISRLFVCMQIAATTASANSGLLDIGVGAAASEVAIINNIWFDINTAEEIRYFLPTAFTVDIPAGSRISARIQCATVANTKPQVTVHGFN